ncbi:MAG: SDR family NAD(P)-dependent oxidoreductase [Allosphingosinicella sp.]|uniref:SDR family NAD(P)-dependent oxidoreductase n=1 Tax=Allosphingosinicella sp. TaxID=2823234 RepID=UPI003941F1E9
MSHGQQSCNRLAERRILITGAASGIGLATARLFAAEDAHLALLDRDREALERIASELGAHAAAVELTEESQIREAVAGSASALGGLDGVVNVAGIGGGTFVESMRLDDWNRVLAVNLTAPFLVCREALPHLRHAGGGTIVNVASGQGLLPSSPSLSAYAASKGGLVTFSKAMALELAPEIRVNAICPGVVDTPLLPAQMRAAARAPGSGYALKRVGEPEEIAAGILFLTSRESAFVTGIALAVDGGRTYH